MSLASSVDHAARAGTRRARFLVDTISPAYIVVYLTSAFTPFYLLIKPPGLVSSVVIPLAGIGILLVTPTERLARVPICLTLVTYVGWCALSLLWTQSFSTTLFALRSEFFPLLVAMLVAGTIDHRLLARTMLAFFVAVCIWGLVASALFPMSRAASFTDSNEKQYGFRGTFDHKNDLGVFAVLTLAIALPLLRSRWRWLVLVTVIATAMSTRSATAASGLAAVGFMWVAMSAVSKGRTRRDRSLLGLLSTSLGVVALLTAFRLMPVFLNLYEKDVTFSGRTVIWTASLERLADQPWHGFGYAGIWTAGVSPIRVELWHRIGFPAAHTHNGAIQLLLDVGIVGLCLMVLFLLSLTMSSVRSLSDRESAPYGRWGVLTVVALVVMSIAEPLLSTPELGVLVMVWVVTTAANNARSNAHRTRFLTTF